jgi:peptidoglycan/xylan/chitin deacetylase (PgdA/CDA1 family)
MRLNRRLLAIAVSLALVSLAAAVPVRLFLDSVYRLPILMYHSIGYTSDADDKMVVSPEAFARQMKFLRDRRYNVITLSKAVEYIKERRRPPPRTVAITLDDGYENNYVCAYPILKQYRLPATIFVIVSFMGKEAMLNWEQLKEMQESRLVDIESHTLTHSWLPSLSDSELRRELEISKDILQNRLGKPVAYLCYPMGGHDERVKKAVLDAGYKGAFGTKPTRLSPNYDVYEIKRVRISRTSSNLFVFWARISGYNALLKVFQKDYKDVPYLIWESRR